MFLIRNQRKGIAKAKTIFMAPTGGILEKYLKVISPEANIYSGGVPMLYYKDLSGEHFKRQTKNSSVYKIINSLKSEGKTIIFHSSRHYWYTQTDNQAIKGNDRLFKGFKEFLRINPDSNFQIVTFEYGIDVNESKKLIKDLNIENNVTWIPKSPRKDLMLGLSISDIVVGELYHSYFTYGIIYEALALKKLIIHNRKDQLYTPYYKNLYNMCFAEKEEDLTRALSLYHNNKIDSKGITENAFDWFLEHLINEPINKVLEILQANEVT